MVYLPAGRPDMTLSLPIISAGVGAAALTGLTALLLLLAGAGDATAQEGLISGWSAQHRGQSRGSRTWQRPTAASWPP